MSTLSLSYLGGLLGRSKFYVSKVYHVLRANETPSVLPRLRHVPSILHLTKEEKLSFANILSLVTKRYDNLFSCSFAYSMGIHQRPTPPKDECTDSDNEANIAHLHVHFFPPLLRSASVRKFLVGYVSCLVIGPLHASKKQTVSNLWPKHNATSHPKKLLVD
jgi:diadenosine tetraphosphate (Ap4A) HIT family hydrolase